MKTKPITLHHVGPTSAGKGFTRALTDRAFSRLVDLSKGEIGIGDEVRNRCKTDTDFKNLYKPMMDEGELLPDSVAIELFKKRHFQVGNTDLLFVDGFCRSEVQIDYAEQNGFLNRGDIVFIFNASIEVCLQRFLERAKEHGKDRTDNEIKTFYKRYHDFERILPALRAMFRESEAFCFEIDANQKIPEFVFPEFISHLLPLFQTGHFTKRSQRLIPAT